MRRTLVAGCFVVAPPTGATFYNIYFNGAPFGGFNNVWYLYTDDPLSSHSNVPNGPGEAGLLTVTATPLPASWTMMLLGFVGLGFFVLRGVVNRRANGTALA